jgi:DNA adenine methylase
MAAVYADPPYDDGFTNYSAGGFSWDDQVRLVKFLADYDGPVIISNKATSRIEELYLDHGYSLTHVDAPRRICLQWQSG